MTIVEPLNARHHWECPERGSFVSLRFFFREQVNMLDPLTSTLLRSGMKIRCRKVFFMLNAATLRYKLGARRLAMCSSVFKFADPLPK